ncbi:unnamed protein product [Prorocentrum cordatum]|uniref:Beta-galactosidase n=1 Tax=Prorocentrum cordatum TaxID=2364126 RepID=A0ABN9VQA5_9DINO|nr:unnamed protein product [Polarella glacialis]
MYYVGLAKNETTWHGRVCLAESTNGVDWVKPEAGVVSFRGSTANNIVMQDTLPVFAVAVLHEPSDKQTERRFKALLKVKDAAGQMTVLATYSSDGVHWSPGRDVGLQVDFCGLMRRHGFYYLTGHTGAKNGARKLQVFMTADFDSWPAASAVGFCRTPPGSYDPERGSAGEQVHQGAALWDRGSVVVGVYGQWHGSETNDRRLVSIDLGLIPSTDGLHFHEPVPHFRLVSAAEDDAEVPPAPFRMRVPALMQGQGFANVGAQTLFWYAPWPEINSDGVRLATWDRDRLGYQSAIANLPDPHLVSTALDSQPEILTVWANFTCTPYSHLRVELLSECFKPLPGFSGADACCIHNGGLEVAVVWSTPLSSLSAALTGQGRVRVKISFCGIRREDARFYALYVKRCRVPAG